MIYLSFTPANSVQADDSYMFVMGEDAETAQPYRMIGSPLFFSSLRDAVDAAAFCGLTVYPDGRVLSVAA